MHWFVALQKWILEARLLQNCHIIAITIFFLAITFLFGCSTSSVLIKPEDQVFNESQQHFERTIALIDEIKPSRSERTLFLQGESFYRYRYEPPKKSKISFLAEAAASITDFPAF
ncbi:MAG: hypothetical protein ACXVLQ_15860, partial [Bacteriovorax sp.]